jgi:serine/threonine protein kinase/WD40 repeat protein
MGKKYSITTYGLKSEKLINLLELGSDKTSVQADGHISGVEIHLADIGEQIGPYKLLSILGEGGFAIVYLASQEKPLIRQVALKIIKPGRNSKQVIMCFESEKQTLALFNHENIARVFDAGKTSGGYPYFVMEYIKGVPITEYCDKERLTIEKRLQLFLNVCEAIQYAHLKGIIHRDIKPSNILVTVQNNKAIPKVIDFGVAKAMTRSAEENNAIGEYGKLIGTREYMSPEQVEITNPDIDTRSDVYSLGVLLYVLLIGLLPFDQKRLKNADFIEVQRIIRQENPPKPSIRLRNLGEASLQIAQNRSTEVKALICRLYKELEWIPIKALRKERERRYQSVTELANDIHNYLNARPLIAGPKSKIYKGKKFIYRNRPLVLSCIAIVLVLAAGILISTAFAISKSRAHAEAVKAMLEAQRSKKAQDLAERLAYFGTIQTVSAKLINHDYSQILPMLEQTDPGRRGWEWGYLFKMCNLPDAVLQAGPGPIGILGISHDGRSILTASTQNLILWDTAAIRPIWRIQFNHPRRPGYFAFDPKGKFLAVLNGGCIYVYAMQNGNLLYQSNDFGYCCICIHPNKPQLYAGTTDGTLFAINTDTWTTEYLRTLSNDRIWHIAIGSSGSRISVSSGKKIGDRVFICSPNNFEVINALPAFPDKGIRGLAILDKLDLLLVVENTVTYLYALKPALNIGQLEGHSQNIQGIAVSSDESEVVTSSVDGKVNIYDTASWANSLNEVLEKKRTPMSFKPDGTIYHGSAVCCVAVFPKGPILSAGEDGTLKQWSKYSLEPAQPIKIPACDNSGSYSLDFREDGKKLAISGWWKCNEVILFDTSTNKTQFIKVEGFDQFGDHRWVRFRPKSRELAVQTFGGLRFYDTEAAGNPQVRWLPMRTELRDFAFDAFGKIMAISFFDKGIQLLNVEDGLPCKVNLESETVESCRLAFSPDSTTLAALDQTRRPSQLYVWNLMTGRLRFQVTMPYGDTEQSGIAFHPSGKYIVTGQNNGEILLWDANSGNCANVIRGHGEGPVNSLQFSKDGARLLSGATDKTVRLWDVESAKPLLTIDQAGYPLSVRFSPDELSIASTDSPVAAWIRESAKWSN